MDFAVVSKRVVTENGVEPAAVLVSDGVIVDLVDPDMVPAEIEIHNVGEFAVLPGLIDVHVHVNEPGRTEWEGFETATQAAAAGGTTTIVEMPLNSSPVTVDAESLAQKIKATENKLWVDVALHAGVIPGNQDGLDDMLAAGCCAGKAFMIDSGMSNFPATGKDDLRTAMQLLAKYDRPLFAHAEVAWGADVPEVAGPWTAYGQYLASRPQGYETAAIQLLIDLCRETSCAVHIVHLSAAEGVPLVRQAKAEGLPITVETAPHYLYFTAEQIPDSATQFKCAPPIRPAENQARLWEAVLDGTIDLIATDHSPCDPSLKLLDEGDFKRAWGGISSLQLLLSATFTAFARRQSTDETLQALARLMSRAPADLLNMPHKGRIAAGCAADLAVFDPAGSFEVTAELLRHRHKISPYVDETLQGVVKQTYVRGELVFDDGKIMERPIGQLDMG